MPSRALSLEFHSLCVSARPLNRAGLSIEKDLSIERSSLNRAGLSIDVRPVVERSSLNRAGLSIDLGTSVEVPSRSRALVSSLRAALILFSLGVSASALAQSLPSTQATSQPTSGAPVLAAVAPVETPIETPKDTPPPPKAPPQGRKRYQATKAEGTITLDGLLDDDSWQAAEARDDFIQRGPNPGGDVYYRTLVKILYDKEALYFGIRCEQSVAPRIRTLRRDNGGIFSDDGLSVKLDPYHDRRTTMSFATNAAGAQFDLLTLDNGKEFISAFDALWEVSTSVDAEGWTAEYRIPFSTLGIPGDGKSVTLGVDFERRVVSRNEYYQWSVLPKGVSDNTASLYGDLVGLEEIKTGQPIQLVPFLVASASSSGTQTNQGIDLKTSLGTIGSAQVSFRTDFAQISPDNAFVNLDRFAVALAERRPFFLEGTDIFKFGSNGSDQLFFSRRIGIEDDPSGLASLLVPIDLGIKAQGRSGPYSFGLLNVLTGESPGLEDGTVIDRADYTVVRARRNIGEAANAGFLVSYKQTLPDNKELATDGISIGTDGTARFLEQRFVVDGSFAFTHNDDFLRDDNNQIVFDAEGRPQALDQDGFSTNANLVYGGDFASPFFSFGYRSKNYNPAVGFVRRTDVASAGGGVEFALRPEDKDDPNAKGTILDPDGKLAAIFFGPDAAVDTDSSFGQILESGAGGFIAASWKSGYNANTGGGVGTSFINEDFEPLPGVLIPAGTYLGGGQGAHFNTPGNKDFVLNIDAGYNFGIRQTELASREEAVNGAYNVSLSVDTKISRYFSAGVGVSDSILFAKNIDGDPTVEDVARGNVFTVNSGVEVAFSRALSLNTTVQLTDIYDPALLEEGVLAARSFGFGLVQSRLSWRFRPGSDLFLVYNIRQNLAVLGEEQAAPEQSLALKISVVLELAR